MKKGLTADLMSNMALNAWSAFWVTVGMGLVGYILYVETGYSTFNPDTEEYLPETVGTGILLMKLYGAALIATGLAIAPLYRRDEHEVARVETDD